MLSLWEALASVPSNTSIHTEKNHRAILVKLCIILFYIFMCVCVCTHACFRFVFKANTIFVIFSAVSITCQAPLQVQPLRS